MFRSIGSAFLLVAMVSIGIGCQADTAGLNKAKAAYFASWTKTAHAPHTMDDLAKVSETTPDFLSFDGMSSGKTVIEGWKDFAGIWEPGMNGFVTASLTEQKSVRTWIGSDVAITASIAHIQGEMQDGKKLDMPGHLTLGWQKINGEWKLVHEHMSLGVKE